MKNTFLGPIVATLILLIQFFCTIAPILLYILIMRIIINSCRRGYSHKNFKNNVVIKNVSKEKKNLYIDVSKEKLKRFNTEDIDTLKDYFYDLFIKFETAYNNLDYNVMKMLSTKQLFQNYYTGIRLDLQVGKKRIINNIQKKQVILYEVDSTVAKQVASVMIEIQYINYIVDKNGCVKSGQRYVPVSEKFEVTFRKDFNQEETTKCPNCGANIIGNKCDYCRTILKNEEFKISNIKKIIENK